MATQISSPVTIQQVAQNILSSRRITRKDQNLLISQLSSSSFDEVEKRLVNRVYELLLKGFIRVVD
ncbi:hypothetical protein IQ249_09290 [Lusitaniella coriacea LEGE 07157]|uniref:Uncharacterized protein n=1 Tax=Lusitaniella coriacea LEGE 07157 TaxID=945747 RepID=A0A8J7ISD3_9CYAN|nr:hypothetical protein [Lusitaniella coriacea]MBE9116087.1 hypothetical protein [Lusitaniella coriacea LEGE 07157]